MLQKKREYLVFLWRPIVFISLLGLIAISISEYEEYGWELRQTFGVLTPASDPMPADVNSCGPTPNSLRIYAGSGTYWTEGDHITLVRIYGKPILSMTRKGRNVFISGDIYGSSGDLVHFGANGFETNANLSFKPKRPDRHTLQVFDNWHREILYIRFLNHNAIQLRGLFDTPWAPPVVVDDNALQVGKTKFIGQCEGNPGKGEGQDAAIMIGN